jgi:hypothetical protein
MIALSDSVADPDLWGYLSFGRLFWHSNKFPYQDIFAYVPTLNQWVYHEWLTGVLYHPLYQALGAPGLQILKYSVGLATAALVYLTAKRRGAHPIAAAVFILIIFCVVASRAYSPVRAQVFTYFFFAFNLYSLERARLTGNWRVLALLPLLQLAWCNMHGGFLAGLGLMAIYAVGEFFSRRPFLPFLFFLTLSVLVTMINPYGINYWKYLIHAVTMPRPFITEWFSVFQSYQRGMANVNLFIYLITMTSVILFGMWQSRWREITSSLALTLTLVLGLRHIRHLTFFLILVGAYLPVCFQLNVKYLQSRSWLTRVWNLGSVKRAFLISLSLLILVNLFKIQRKQPFSLVTPGTLSSEKLASLYMDVLPYPVEAIKFIKKKGFTGNILTQFGWGEFIIWELHPQCLVAFDGRYETVYPSEVQQKFFDFYFARPQWRRFLEEYPPDMILLNKKKKIAKLLQKDSHWRQIYSDSTSVLFVARTKQSLVLLKENPSQ